MITSVSFENYKGFERLNISDMTRLVLLSGRNNVGKTSILEGMFLFIDHASTDSFMKLSSFRGIKPSYTNSMWESIFHNMDTTSEVRISVVDDGVLENLTYSIDRSYVPSDDSVPTDTMNSFVNSARINSSLKSVLTIGDYQEICHFTVSKAGVLGNTSVKGNKPKVIMRHEQFINSAIAAGDFTIMDWLGKAELSGSTDKIVKALRIIEPDISDIRMLSIGGVPTLYANIKGKVLPIKLCGDGINRLLYIILSIMENNNSVIYIDEIENGFHYSLYPKIWEILAVLSKESNSQIICTTHSMECIHSAVTGVTNADMANQFSYYRIGRDNGMVKAHRLSLGLLKDAMDAEMEVR